MATPKPEVEVEVGGVWNSQQVWFNDWRTAIPGLKPVAITALKLCAIRKNIRPQCEVGPFLKRTHILDIRY